MKNINLEQAQELLRKAGYNLSLTSKEAFLARYSVCDDLRWKLIDEENLTKEEVDDYFKGNEDFIKDTVFESFNNHDGIGDAYEEILSNTFEDLKERTHLQHLKELYDNEPSDLTTEEINYLEENGAL